MLASEAKASHNILALKARVGIETLLANSLIDKTEQVFVCESGMSFLVLHGAKINTLLKTLPILTVNFGATDRNLNPLH